MCLLQGGKLLKLSPAVAVLTQPDYMWIDVSMLQVKAQFMQSTTVTCAVEAGVESIEGVHELQCA